MLNILIPLAGKGQYFPDNEFPFPKPLIEIGSKTIIERVIENLKSAGKDVHFIFVIKNDECIKYHLDQTLNLITDGKCDIVKINKDTQGSACSSLMAIEFINNKIPLLIANGDQLLDISIDKIINYFSKSDGGVVAFDSVHPRWSYVRVDDNNNVLEAAEKQPLSRHAIAGLYYYSAGSDFVNSAMKMIKKGEQVNGVFYISPTFNQMILDGKKIKMKKVDNNIFHTFYTPQKISEYEIMIKSFEN
jgi:dTDP-glucose pyrophosphorylase